MEERRDRPELPLAPNQPKMESHRQKDRPVIVQNLPHPRLTSRFHPRKKHVRQRQTRILLINLHDLEVLMPRERRVARP